MRVDMIRSNMEMVFCVCEEENEMILSKKASPFLEKSNPMYFDIQTSQFVIRSFSLCWSLIQFGD